MKIIRLTAAIAAASVSAFAMAQHASDSGLAGSGSGTGSIQSSVPIAIVAECETLGAFQVLTGIVDLANPDTLGCLGNTSKLCAPSINPSVLRKLLLGSSTAGISGGVGTLLSQSGNATVNAACVGTSAGQFGNITKRYAAEGTIDAISQYMGSGDCGGNASPAFVTVGTVASVQVGLDNNKVPVGFIAATDIGLMDDSVGFIKLDGRAPDLVNHLDGGYDLVANITDVAPTVADFDSRGTTFGIALGPYHSQTLGGGGVACGSLNN